MKNEMIKIESKCAYLQCNRINYVTQVITHKDRYNQPAKDNIDMKAKNSEQEKYFYNQRQENEKQRATIDNLKQIIENKDIEAKRVKIGYERRIYAISE